VAAKTEDEDSNNPHLVMPYALCMENVYLVVGYEPYESDIYEEKVYLCQPDALAEAARLNLAGKHGREWDVVTMKVIPQGGA
jgi:hypothetical protein